MFSLDKSESPLQLYQLGNDNVQCYQASPAKHLQPYIHYFWWLDIAPGDTSLEVIPDNAVDLVMSPDIPSFSILYLPVSEKFTIPLSGPITYVGISFRAEAAARFFNVDPEVMKNCLPGADATESLGIADMVNEVQALKQHELLADVMNELAAAKLNSQLAAKGQGVKLNFSKVLAAMQASVGARGMESIAEHFDLSDRQFRRIMGSLFGYGPKKIQRVMRLQASLKEILVADSLAAVDGFYDDAHRIKEIRKLTGLTPGEIRKMAEIYNSMS